MEECIKRVEWIDMIKGGGIILVMLGHTIFPDPIKAEIYTFHMPLFFFISGYVFSIKKFLNFRSFLKYKIRKLLLPLLEFSCLITIVYTLVDMVRKIEYSKALSNLRLNMLATITQVRGMGISVLWFIGCLFFCQIILYTIVKATKDKNKEILISVGMVFLIGIIYRKIININLPYSIDVSLIAILFFGIGYLFKKCFKNIKLYLKFKYIALYLIINIVFGLLNFNVIDINIDMYGNRYGNYLFFIISAISGIFACITFVLNIKYIPILGYIGKNSLIYYSLHQAIVFKLLNLIIPKDLIEKNLIWQFFIGIIYVTFACAILYFISKAINQKFSFLIGK